MTENKGILFSIVIPAYNEEKNIKVCLDYVKKATAGLVCEIIVVDNNSVDKTSQVAKDCGVKVILETMQGVGAARRSGTAVATGQYVLHIDADTHLPANYLLEVKQRFEKDPDLACIGGQMYFYDAPLWKNFLRIFVHQFLWFFALVMSKKTQGPMGNNMTFKNSAYKQTTGFDEKLRFGEDMDLAKKLSHFGKVRLDMSLKCPVSSRRFKIDKGLFDYSMNFLSMSTKGEPRKNDLPPAKEVVEKDYSKLKKFVGKK